MRVATSCVLFVLLSVVGVVAQSPAPPDVSVLLKDLADNYSTRDRRETLTLVEPVLARVDLTPAQRIEALRIKGNAEIAVGSNDKAVATLEEAIAALPAAADPRSGIRLRLSLANAYRGQKKLELALRESLDAQRAIEALDDDGLLLECLTAQLHYIPDSDVAVWRPVADKAMALAQRLGERGAEGRIQHLLADRDFSRGEYASAVRRLEVTVTALRAAGAPDAMALSRALTSLGRARRAHGLPERALDAYAEAMEVQKRIGDRFGVVQTWNAMGVAWGHLNRTDKSLECYQNGLSEAIALGDQSAVQFMEGAVATALLRSGKAVEAIPIFERLLAQNPEPYIARFRLAALADAYLEVGRSADALATVDKALALDHASHPDAVAGFQFTRARSNGALGRHADAIADARRALATYERIRESLLPLDFIKRGYSDQIQGVFDFTVGALEEAGRSAEAVEAAEAARGRALADLMASRATVPGDGAPARNQNGDAAAALLTGGSPADAAPSGLDSPVATQALSSAELSSLAAAHHTTIVSYWVGAERSFVWVVRADGGIYSATLPVTRARLQQLVDQASRPPTIAVDGKATNADPAELALRRLYDTLIAPIDALLPAAGARLTVVPHGPLFSLSFAALKDRRGRYLIERYAVHDVPSGAVLALGASRPANRAAGWLLVADPQPRPRGAVNLPALPGARQEITAARAVAPADVTRLVGAEASEQAFRTAVSDARVVHVAAHAVVPNKDPAGAFLALGRGGGTTRGAAADGRLTAAEIYDLTVQADLVVLSACRSGQGRITGDGVAGFTRAFISAGARTVVASVWDAPDQSTRRLMAAFYTQRAAGKDSADALRAAQRGLLADLRAGRVKVPGPAGDVVLPPHPALWAGFRVHGVP